MTTGLYTARVQPVFVRKTADETVNNSAALQNDDHLALAVSASATYIVNLMLIVDGSTVADLNMGFTGPAGAVAAWTPMGYQNAHTAATGFDSVKLGFHALGDAQSVGLNGVGSKLVILPRMLLRTSTTAGTLQFQRAQNVADATATTVYTDSWLRLERVA